MRRSFPCIMLLLATACSNSSASKAEMVVREVAPTRLQVGDRPRAIESGDLNGDKLVDLVVANADSGTVSVLSADGEGGFVRTDIAAGNEPSDVELIDVDKDGDRDIVIANHETSGVTLLLNDGSGAFGEAAGSPFDLGAKPHLHGLATGDFDGDGWVDVAADSSDNDSIAMLFGSSTGFGAARQVPAGSFPYYRIDEISVGEGEGFAILVPSPRANSVRRLDIGSEARLGPAIAMRGAMMVVAANLDAEGGHDFVAIGENRLQIFRDQNGQYVQSALRQFDNPVELAVGDVDGDGKDEIAVSLWDSDEIFILASDGRERGSIKTCMRPAALLLSDLDGDGKAELVAGCWNEPEIRIFRDLP